MKTIIHHLACYLSIVGLGFLFACLIMGAVEYLLGLAVFMTLCALVAVLTDTRKGGLDCV